jgi:hypothetical protein
MFLKVFDAGERRKRTRVSSMAGTRREVGLGHKKKSGDEIMLAAPMIFG